MRAYLGLGANIGDRKANLRLALRWLAPACEVVAVSSLYASDAVVLPDAPPGPEFRNAACAVETALSPAELLAHVKRIEHDIGRRPSAQWSPRPIDIDILLYGGAVLDEDTPAGSLVVPHPLLDARNFVVVPLAEIAPDAMHSEIGRTVADLADDIDVAGLRWLAGPEWVSGGPAAGEDEDGVSGAGEDGGSAAGEAGG
jgi:2-amino-4-hydroxy-6-hydroxymethyldihydropteridine diphosphokinase